MIDIKGMCIKVSVRNLVEFLMRSGDLDNRRGAGANKEAMQAGSRIHRRIQKSMGTSYKAEVPMKLQIERQGFTFQIEGRADGIIEEKQVTIDEIKGVYRDIAHLESPVPVHRAQAMCYAYIYCEQHNIEEIYVQMTYCNLETEEIRRFRERFLVQEIKDWFAQLLDEYMQWAKMAFYAREERNISIRKIEFPFSYREGQKNLTVSVYRAIQLARNLFIQAPTGVGKTMSTIFPAIKAVGEGLGEKIFYLTAKTITRTVAYDAFQILKKQGLSMSVVMLTAKEKMCVLDKSECNPDACERAKGHWDRVNAALYDILCHEKNMDREIILIYAQKYMVCPFELSLDICSFTDAVICDYNYVFDPNVHLNRFFGDGVRGEYIFLIDEAHNLVDRARDMYSASLCKESFLEIKRLVAGKSRKLTRALERCNQELLALKKECEGVQVLATVGGFSLNLLKVQTELDVFLEEEKEFDGKEELLNFYFDVLHFLNMHEWLDENYEIYTELRPDGRFLLRLYCVNPSHNLSMYLKKGKSAVFFSATLLPMAYYKEMLGNLTEDYAIYVDSPFDSERRMLSICSDVSSKYTRRGQKEYEKIFDYINLAVDGKKGNYMVFFPSYKLMKAVYDVAIERGFEIKADMVIQENHMTEQERERFLALFSEERKKSLTAFCVMGGIFSEGIDLVEDQLIGALIVGTGLPMICSEREILKIHYDKKGMDGFAYAYLYPGMNKVLQAAGRVIRTDEDRGIVLLLDERFLQREYLELFPREWEKCLVCSRSNVGMALDDFWKNV